ncbi:formylglycine-generating enzyme family protein [Sorangium sp. So ce1000]|uniref:formylglycine-generating enzyme family protein n=1 Tax=Sorangium sp. So ce1000 TaxID=3133325 RepID=UPI003F616024
MTARGVSRALAAVALLLSGCEPEPRQWLVSVSTDAPTPRFGDHLLLEVMGEDASCTGCMRLIGVDGPDSLPVSFGVVPRNEGATVRIRARLYRAEQAGPDGLPSASALIDAVAKLPPLDGETLVAFDLSMRCFGVPSLPDQGATCDPNVGALAPEPVLPLLSDVEPRPEPGSWPSAAAVSCQGPAPAGMVCVPGGVFLLGTPRPGYTVDIDELSQPERLVQLGAFAIDVDEVTVGTVRELVATRKIRSEPAARDVDAPGSGPGACTYIGASDGANDALPVNCVTHALAEEVCSALGKRLPTEAEWEYAAGNLGDETAYPWGNGGDLCAMALLGRGRGIGEADADVYENFGCRPLDAAVPWGPVAGGAPSDVTALGVRNLGGSMSEWVADTFAPYAAPCWQAGGPLLVDPVCREPAPGAGPSFSYRGSAWSGYKLAARAAARSHERASTFNPGTGFRCAKPM